MAFCIYAFLSLSFAIYIMGMVNMEDDKYERDILNSPENRRRYFYEINTKWTQNEH